MSRKRYPEEFKIEAVKQVTEAGFSMFRSNEHAWEVCKRL